LTDTVKELRPNEIGALCFAPFEFVFYAPAIEAFIWPAAYEARNLHQRGQPADKRPCPRSISEGLHDLPYAQRGS